MTTEPEPPLDDVPESGAGKRARGEQFGPDDPPPWQKPDYRGPLTHEQAAWRFRNLRQK